MPLTLPPAVPWAAPLTLTQGRLLSWADPCFSAIFLHHLSCCSPVVSSLAPGPSGARTCPGPRTAGPLSAPSPFLATPLPPGPWFPSPQAWRHCSPSRRPSSTHSAPAGGGAPPHVPQCLWVPEPLHLCTPDTFLQVAGETLSHCPRFCGSCGQSAKWVSRLIRGHCRRLPSHSSLRGVGSLSWTRGEPSGVLPAAGRLCLICVVIFSKGGPRACSHRLPWAQHCKATLGTSCGRKPSLECSVLASLPCRFGVPAQFCSRPAVAPSVATPAHAATGTHTSVSRHPGWRSCPAPALSPGPGVLDGAPGPRGTAQRASW